MTANAPVVVRAARPDDLPAVAASFLACWRTSYAGFLPRAVIDLYDEDGALDLWRPTLSGPLSRGVVLVAEGAGRGVLGVIRIGRDPAEPASGHVYSLYVRPDTQGLGVGTKLLTAAGERFRRDGVRVATLWVFAANKVALGFYARQGWLPDGGRRVEPQYGEPELHLRRTLSRSARATAAG
ncbi:MAG TPA: GNAT family N-acetyltransferase [Patescibacteria group bacterium]|nr:GNAT family N-acetyltransferase [Patescibacteria group bacterium]